MQQTYYHILDVSPLASDEDVRRAYHALVRRWHPDRNPQRRAQAEDMFRQIGTAYSMLRTAPQRKAYNRYLIKAMGLDQPESQIAPRERKPGKFAAVLLGLFEIFWPFTLRREIRHG